MAQKKDSVNVSVEDLQTALVSAVTAVTSVFARLNQRAGTSSASGTSSKSKQDDVDDDDFQQRPLRKRYVCIIYIMVLRSICNIIYLQKNVCINITLGAYGPRVIFL